MERRWGSLFARSERLTQVRSRLNRQVGIRAVAGIVFTAGLVLVLAEPRTPAARVLLAIPVFTWSVPSVIRWRFLTWPIRLVSVGGIVFTAAVVLSFFGPNGPIGRVFGAVAVFTWAIAPLIRLGRLTWAKRLAAVAASVFLMTLAASVIVDINSASLDNVVGFTVLILLLLAALSYIGAHLSRVTAAPATRVLIALSIIFLYSFLPLLAFLATNGGASFGYLFLQEFKSGYSWLSLLQDLLQVLVPLLLIMFPETLRRRLVGAEMSTRVEELVPIQLAFAALLVTGLYAATLHFAKGPLDNVSTNQLVFAILAVMVLLGPFYKYIATACWKRGIEGVFNPRSWFIVQKELAKLLRKSIAASIGSETHASSLTDETIPPETRADTATKNSTGAKPS